MSRARASSESPHSPLPTPHSFAVSVVERLQEAGHVAVFAGGCVRDMLLASDRLAPPDDYDVATDATPQRVRELFGRKSTLAVGESFGVIIVIGPKIDGRHLQVEVATFRSEGEYSDGRRPDKVVFCTAEEDAARRDFTINGMFYDPLNDRVLDYVGGQDDLENGIVRAIGDPHARIAEDKLRMLRAVRFTARFGFALDRATEAAIEKHAAEITVVSWERITQELAKILRHPRRSYGVRLATQVGLLAHALPELPLHTAEFEETLGILATFQEPSLPLALAALLHTRPPGTVRRPKGGTVSAIGRRLKLSNDDREATVWLVEQLPAITEFGSLELADQKLMLVDPRSPDLIELGRAKLVASNRSTSPVDQAAEFLKSTSRTVLCPEPLIDGAALKSLGMKPGPEFKDVLNQVRRLQLNEQIATYDEALAIVQMSYPSGSSSSS